MKSPLVSDASSRPTRAAARRSVARRSVARLSALIGKLKQVTKTRDDDDDDLPGPNATVSSRPFRFHALVAAFG